LLDLDPGLLAAGLLLPDVALVLVLPVVHDPGHGRLSLGGHLDEVEVQVLGALEGVLGRDDPDLRAVGPDEADLGAADPGGYARVDRDRASPPREEERAPTVAPALGNDPVIRREYRCGFPPVSRVISD